MRRPSAIRLIARTARGKPPKPLFGIGAWTSAAADVAVFLDAPRGDRHVMACVAEQLPPASTLPSGTAVYVLGGAASDKRLWRLLGRTVPVARAARCTALLIKGYVEIGAGIDDVTSVDLAWGSAP